MKYSTWQGMLIGIGLGLAGGAYYPKLRSRIQKNILLLSSVTDAMVSGATKAQVNVNKWVDVLKDDPQDQMEDEEQRLPLS